MSSVGSLGAPRLTRTAFYFTPAARTFKDTGIMEESTNSRPARRRVPLAAAKPARKHAPDDANQPG